MRKLVAGALLLSSIIATPLPSTAQSYGEDVAVVMAHVRTANGQCVTIGDGMRKIQACDAKGAVPGLRVLVSFTMFTQAGPAACSGNFLYRGIDQGNGQLDEEKIICKPVVQDLVSDAVKIDLVFLESVHQLAESLRLKEANL